MAFDVEVLRGGLWGLNFRARLGLADLRDDVGEGAGAGSGSGWDGSDGFGLRGSSMMYMGELYSSRSAGHVLETAAASLLPAPRGGGAAYRAASQCRQ